MATDISLDGLTNGEVIDGEWVGTGTFDVLIDAVNQNIGIQYDKGRIKGVEYANVYLGSMQAIISESINFLLQEKVQEAQADSLQVKINADRNRAEAELEKQWGYDVTRVTADDVLLDPTLDLDELIMGDSNGNGKIERELDEQESTGAKQRSLITIQEEVEQYKIDNVLPKQAEEIDAGIALTTEKTESEAKQNEADGVIDTQVAKMKEDVKIAQEEVKIAISKESREYTAMIGELDKVLGYNYTLDAEFNVERDSLTDAGDGKLDAEVADIEAGIDLTAAQTAKIAYDSKLSLLNAQLGSMVELYKGKQLDDLTEVVTNQTQVEELYNSMLNGDITPIDVGE